ncbi:MAG: hypothetical protein DCC49_13345 [Acidobacteria bacterium]|nr:MAG: hypothetical protein DCC49_13345 [Acidobacteriota bacterium]
MKALYALSGNTCAYRRCEVKLADPSWGGVRADVAHIRGARPGSPRYDLTMSDAERHSFENLILLCPNCHRLVDVLDPDGHPVELLEEMKREHEERGQQAIGFASEAEQDRVALLLIEALGVSDTDPGIATDRADVVAAITPTGRRHSYRLVITNRGPGVARNVSAALTSVSHLTEQVLVHDSEFPIPQLVVGQGYPVAVAGNAPPPYDCALTWEDDSGSQSATLRLSLP